MDVVSLIIKVVLCVCSLFLIIVVLLQSEEGQNRPVGAGGVSKKARGLDALLARLTKIAAVLFMVLSFGLVLIQKFS